MSEKDALVFVEEDGKIHIAWEYDDMIVVFEHIPENYPSVYLTTWDFEDYYESVKNVDWVFNNINDEIITYLEN